MLLTTHVQVTIWSSEIRDYYTKLGYICKIHEKIFVQINHVPNKVKNAVVAKCDYCGEIQSIRYSKYLRSTKHNTCKYSCSNVCGRLKATEYLLENFNVINVSQIPLVKENKKAKVQAIYGVDNVSQSKEVQEKVKQTKKNKYNDPHYNNPQKNKETLIKNHGDCNYGLYGSESYNEKIKNKYGDINPSSTPEAIQKKQNTSIKNFGVKHPSQSETIKDKISETNFKKYKVKAPLQNFEIFEKNQKSAFKIKLHEKTNLFYRGTYENHFLDYCFTNNIEVLKGISIPYFYENKARVYHSDFYFKNYNLIIEIKSEYYYKKYLSQNLSKQKSCIEHGYNFIFILDKKYEEFCNLVNQSINKVS
jgi:hypothetical protein